MQNSSSSDKSQYEAEILRVVQDLGYTQSEKLGDTLQGSIWKVNNSIHKAVMKATRKHLHKRSTTVVNGIELPIHENIMKEQAILQYLTRHNECPRSIVQFVCFVPTDLHFYLLMENGGDSLFDFVTSAHQLIATGHLDRCEWNDLVAVMFRQMIECVDYIHSKRVCHFDISLENLVVNDVALRIMPNNPHKISFVKDDVQVKLCDFGLADVFDETSDFSSLKYCGKKQYQSPEAARREGAFNAKKNDIWALGLCLFMMTFGCAPWRVADSSDELFVYVKRYSLTHLLNRWGVVSYANQNVLSVLNSIFEPECDRICLKDIQKQSI